MLKPKAFHRLMLILAILMALGWAYIMLTVIITGDLMA